MLRLRQEIDELKSALARAEIEPPSGTEMLSQGDDPVAIQYFFLDYSGATPQRHDGTCETTWNRIFSAVAPLMIDEVGEQVLRRTLEAFVASTVASEIDKHSKGSRPNEVRIIVNDFQTIKIQLRALGLIEKSEKQRSLKDKETYWTLTLLGDKIMTQLRAIRKTEATT